MPDLTPLENLRVLLQDLIDSERTIMCSPEWESRIKSMIAASPCAGLWTVTVLPGMGDDRFYVLDHQALEAAANQAMQRIMSEPPPQLFSAADLAAQRSRWSYNPWRDDRGIAPRPDPSSFRNWPIA